MFDIATDVSAAAVFLQGLLSFFSPCVLPLLPLYFSYLSGGAKDTDEEGNDFYSRSRVMINTLFFVLGISGAFFLLGFGFTALGSFFSSHRLWFARISGVLIILFGLYQLGIFGQSKRLSKERRLPLALDKLSMNPLTALLLGFTFSFAWTPCVGPMLSSVLLMAGSSASSAAGFLLIGAYTLGFAVPFLITGVFAGAMLNLFSRHMNIVKYTVKIGGVIMIIMGVLILSGRMSGINAAIGGAAADVPSQESQQENTGDEKSEEERPIIPAPDFTLKDQFGNTHTLSEYKGKTVFMNFWATWCGFCVKEMPDIQKLYEEYGENQGDVIILGIANPKTDGNSNAADEHIDKVISFLEDKDITYPSVMDLDGSVFANYGASGLPTTFMIDKEGNVYGYLSGAMSYETMVSIIEQTMEGRNPDKN